MGLCPGYLLKSFLLYLFQLLEGAKLMLNFLSLLGKLHWYIRLKSPPGVPTKIPNSLANSNLRMVFKKDYIFWMIFDTTYNCRQNLCSNREESQSSRLWNWVVLNFKHGLQSLCLALKNWKSRLETKEDLKIWGGQLM